MAKKIDWTKPLVAIKYFKGCDVLYVGLSSDVDYPHVVAFDIGAGRCELFGLNDYGYFYNMCCVANAPEPEELQNGLWANINRDSGGDLYLDLSVYRTRADAERAAGPSHFKSIRLSTVPFISSGPSEDDGLDQ